MLVGYNLRTQYRIIFYSTNIVSFFPSYGFISSSFFRSALFALFLHVTFTIRVRQHSKSLTSSYVSQMTPRALCNNQLHCFDHFRHCVPAHRGLDAASGHTDNIITKTNKNRYAYQSPLSFRIGALTLYVPLIYLVLLYVYVNIFLTKCMY